MDKFEVNQLAPAISLLNVNYKSIISTEQITEHIQHKPFKFENRYWHIDPEINSGWQINNCLIWNKDVSCDEKKCKSINQPVDSLSFARYQF